MAFGKNDEKKIFSDINITPLTDIFLVLLIIMMVVAPALQSNDANIDIPEINNGVNMEESKVTVSVTDDGTTYLNGEPVSSISDLTDKLVALKDPDSKKQEVVVKADKNIQSSKILDIMDAAQNAEYKKLVVAGEPLNKKEQRDLKSNDQRQQVEIPTEAE